MHCIFIPNQKVTAWVKEEFKVNSTAVNSLDIKMCRTKQMNVKITEIEVEQKNKQQQKNNNCTNTVHPTQRHTFNAKQLNQHPDHSPRIYISS